MTGITPNNRDTVDQFARPEALSGARVVTRAPERIYEPEPDQSTEFGDKTVARAKAELEILQTLVQSGKLAQIEHDVAGAELEGWLVDASSFRPSTTNLQILSDPRCPENWQKELGGWNLEANAPALTLKGNALSRYEDWMAENIEQIDQVASHNGSRFVLGGTLLTLRPEDLHEGSLTAQHEELNPEDRYRFVNKRQKDLSGGQFSAGDGESSLQCDSIALAASAAGLQPHLQVRPEEFISTYNAVQAISALLVAGSCSSPEIAGRTSAWDSARIQTLCEMHQGLRHSGSKESRFVFGDNWQNDPLEDFQDAVGITPLFDDCIESTGIELLNLRRMESVNWKFTRSVYDVQNDQPHIRIEFRAIDTALSVIDNAANLAWFYGLAIGMRDGEPHLTQRLAFSDAKDNFFRAAKLGLNANFTMMDEESMSARELGLRLLPVMRKGLEALQIDSKDISRYEEVIRGRLESGITGSRWIRNARIHLHAAGASHDECDAVITQAIIANQNTGIPVHEWELPKVSS